MTRNFKVEEKGHEAANMSTNVFVCVEQNYIRIL